MSFRFFIFFYRFWWTWWGTQSKTLTKSFLTKSITRGIQIVVTLISIVIRPKAVTYTQEKTQELFSNIDIWPGRLHLVSLKYKMKIIARTRTVMIAPMVHLFLFILLVIAVNIFLLFPTLSSTPWSVSCARKRDCLCPCKSWRIETPSSSVSSIVFRLSLILSVVLPKRSVDIINLDLWSAEA